MYSTPRNVARIETIIVDVYVHSYIHSQGQPAMAGTSGDRWPAFCQHTLQTLLGFRPAYQRAQEHASVDLLHDSALGCYSRLHQLVKLDQVIPRHSRKDMMTDVHIDVVPEETLQWI